jgi:RNA-directed DNA polymerase
LERPPLSSTTRRSRLIARGLADVLVSGRWREDDLVARGNRALGGGHRWLRPVVRRLLAATGGGPRPRAARVAAMLLDDPGFRLACEEHELSLAAGPGPAPAMWPAAGAPSSWAVPAIATPGALADRLGLVVGALDWLADCQARERRTRAGPGRRYDYRWMAKPSGSARLIEVPRPFLKAIQRRVLREVLGAIPPHDAAHAFRPGRSVRTFVAPHVGRRVVLELDLRDFFPAITAARVTSLFLTAGYPEPVARLLAGLCTNSAPPDVVAAPGCPDAWRARRLFGRPHLPQGAPSSPALANLCAHRLDVRLSGLAATADAHYTRYADDLAFSGGPDFERSVARFHVHACAIALEEGFEVNTRKTRVMRRGVRQRVAGVVLNDRPNVARDEYDALKATLHNCARLGPVGQNHANHPDFRAHLTGRVAHIASINPDRGRRLRAILDRIAW